MIEGTFPTGRVDPIGVAPAEVVRRAARCELLEAVVKAASDPFLVLLEHHADMAPHVNAEMRRAADALRAALVAAGATGKAGT